MDGIRNATAGEMSENVRSEQEEDVIKIRKDPKVPTKKEVGNHNLTQLPFRGWCPTCVKARGRELDHKKDRRRDRNLPEYSWD